MDNILFNCFIIYVISTIGLLSLIYYNDEIYKKYEIFHCYIPILNTILLLKEILIISYKAIKR